MNIINAYLLVVNIISLLLMGIDKLLAITKKRRIPEFTLLTLSIFGGTLGTILAMFIFRHKIRKIKFLLLIPLTILYIVYYIYKIYM